MKLTVRAITGSLLQLFYPHICAGCGSDILPQESSICIKCLFELPATGFERHDNNPVEKMLAGRIAFDKATAQYYFNKESLIQKLMHAFKYRGDKKLGHQLGVLMGKQLNESQRFENVDALVPLPLFEDKERQRGFNQSALLCKGIAEVMNVPVIENAVIRPLQTETQTKKNRMERWKNMEGKFMLSDGPKISGRHILLVDDVITTGATMESCATTVLQAGPASMNIATLCFASHI